MTYVLFFSLFLFIVLHLHDNLKLIPTTLQFFFETIVAFIFNLIKQQLVKMGMLIYH
jgi:F0F1-type ATP synthase membrane subunit a